jgi:hypothetical protein
MAPFGLGFVEQIALMVGGEKAVVNDRMDKRSSCPGTIGWAV